ncbi:MAG: hypothetical protein J6W43_07870 [Prevotella sp.]|jgi:uncharacterized membrane protein|nr:hypothetical protein [Prevotella sp.]
MSIVSPFIADIMLWLMYIAVAAAIVVTLWSVVKTLRMRTKDDEIINGVPQTRIAWTTAGCFLVCLAVTYLLGSSDPLMTNGALFTSKFWLKATDMFIYTSIILIIGCLVGVIVSRFRN